MNLLGGMKIEAENIKRSATRKMSDIDKYKAKEEHEKESTDKKQGKKELVEKEIVRTVKKIKLGKAAGIDGIPMEV